MDVTKLLQRRIDERDHGGVIRVLEMPPAWYSIKGDSGEIEHLPAKEGSELSLFVLDRAANIKSSTTLTDALGWLWDLSLSYSRVTVYVSSKVRTMKLTGCYQSPPPSLSRGIADRTGTLLAGNMTPDWYVSGSRAWRLGLWLGQASVTRVRNPGSMVGPDRSTWRGLLINYLQGATSPLNRLVLGNVMLSEHSRGSFPLGSTALGIWRSRLAVRSGLAEALRMFRDGECDEYELMEVVNDAVRVSVPVESALQYYNRLVSDRSYMRWGRCAWCGTFTTRSDLHENSDTRPVCEECVDDHFVTDADSGDLRRRDYMYYHEDSDEWHTYQPPEDESDSDYILNYSDNVLRYRKADSTVVSSPVGDFLMGIELEVEAEYRTESAEYFHSQFKDYAILKYDGSLNDEEGIEIVTAPRGLAEHIRRFKAFDAGDDVVAWDSGACGMHVHIDSRAFTALTLGKFIEFINAPYNDDLIKNIAGRHPATSHQSAAYCQRETELPLGNPKGVLEGKSGHRYRMVNTTTLGREESKRLQVRFMDAKVLNTVELRIFRATLNKRRLLAQIEFAHAAVMFCRTASMKNLREGAFLSWLRGMAGIYPNLAKWFGVKQQKATPEEVSHPVTEEV